MNFRERILRSHSNRDRGSQESKVTSTPQTLSPVFSLSPSISTIGNEEVPMEIDSESGDDVTMTSLDAKSSLGESVSKGQKVKKRKPMNIKWVGIWSSLKPKNKESLYYKIVTQPEDLESIAIDLLHTYINNDKSGVLSILQLFVDLCGYKKLPLSKIYNFEKQNSKEIVEKMRYELMDIELKKTGNFLFMKCSKFETAIDGLITDFLKHLIYRSFTKEVLFDDIFIGHILEFINCMAFSAVRCIRITGVVLVIKFLTVFVNIYSEFFILDQSSNSTTERVDERKEIVENFIDFLYLIYDKNCLIPDKKCYLIKVKCAQEMYQWIKLFPDIFIFKRKCLGRLMKLIVDPNEMVRQSAITTCEKIITCEAIQAQMKKRIDLCLKVVSNRILDVNYKVAIKAVNIFTAALDKYATNITKSQKLLIIHRMYEKNFLLAKAAGKFFAVYLEQESQNEEKVLLNLVKVAFLKEKFAERLPFFLEACIDHVPQLKDFGLFIKVVLNSEIEFQTRKQLLQVFSEVVRFFLTGNLSNARRTILGAPQNSDDHLAAADAIIPNFENMVIQFQTDKNSLKLLTELLMFIDYDLDHPDTMRKHYLGIITLLKDLFFASNDNNLLENVTNAFSCFCTKLRNVRTEGVIDRIKNNYVNSLSADLNQLSPTSDKNLLINLREKSMKLSILFAKFNLTSVLKWEEIFQVWDSNYLKVLKYLMVCCKWYLIWGLRTFIRVSMDLNTEPNRGDNRLLYTNCTDFVYGCLEMLRHANGNSEYFLIFEALCDLYVAFDKELKMKRQFSNFVIKITEPNHYDVLLDFVKRHVIENTTLHLNQRQKYLNNLVNVIYLEGIPVEAFANILRYYHTHYLEFGTIMNEILQQLSSCPPTLPLLIIHTLSQFFKQILDKYQEVNLLSDEAKELKFLAKKFASLKQMKSPNDMLKLVNMFIYFAFREKKNYVFLYFARYFAKMLNESGKSEAYHLFLRMVPEEEKNNDIFLLFGSTLKPK